MQAIRDVLRGTLGRSLRAMPALDRLAAAWRVACGTAMAQHGEAVEFTDGVLWIAVFDDSWMPQMNSMAEMLARDVGRIAGVPVRAIHFKLRRSM